MFELISQLLSERTFTKEELETLYDEITTCSDSPIDVKLRDKISKLLKEEE
jgi:hypothetical protein